jgi:hypothetical protein
MVTFAEAVTVLEDAFALTRDDPAAVDEARFVTLGVSNVANQRELYEKSRG